jgi:histidinol-phosphate aminotransferase
MKRSLNRREWLKTTLIGSAGLTMTGSLNLINCQSNQQTDNSETDSIILLDQNENPYGISEKAKVAVNDALKYSNRYPEAHMEELKEIIAEREGFTKDNIVLGAGATEIFRTAGILYCSDGKEVLLADPSYFGFVNYTEKIKGNMIKVPLDSEYKHDLKAMSREVSEKTSMIYICNPNNPTGTIVSGKRLREFCIEYSKHVPVFIDEAYHDFAEDPEYFSMTGIVKEGHNIIIARTFSKIHGFAGLRIGYAIAKPEIVEEFKRIRTNFASTGVLSLRAAIANDNKSSKEN